ncbi:TonB-linked outer membrane protein, SusC/RagA family [Chitinophaga jiangningensis]|uniref:TonB-linked outer membrane protein, SusC/RagA family n=1 Tax=Chitinophaga jiangningensis TaxID=1419482 RepID=A0A1M7F8X7_9BACT|nr:SusC/RagA family TonB-linked outer membrane protein [Chitinophaga jiangningensis]SHM00228.1 TonB-linked outer membrane protein, SusC/RagA family [Chitinophaga jiangningensis]
MKNFLLFFVIFLMADNVLFAQQKKITGTVKDKADKSALPGVNIRVKGTTRGTRTDANGMFTIMADGKETIIFSSIGMMPKEIKVDGQTVINVELSTDVKQLDNVVVTALNIKRDEKSLGYATTVVKGEQLTQALSGNWTDALSGKVAGLNLIRSNSGPAGSNKIILRGENNLTDNNEALIVVDGVVINNGSARRTAVGGESAYGTNNDNMPADYGSGLNDINPEDIESINVLKGPGAAALYGQRGANGAIIITTKSGSSKKKGWGVTLNSNANMEKVNRFPDLQYEYGQGLDGADYYSYGTTTDGASTSGTSSAYGPKFDGQQFYQYDPVTQKVGSTKTPWKAYNNINDYWETARTLTNSVTLDGGTDKTSARFSFTNVNNTWIVPNTGYKRNSLAMSVNSKINDKLQVSAKVNYNNKWSDNLPGAGYGNQSIMYWYIFWQPSADINWLKNYWGNGSEGKTIKYPFSSYPSNPYAVAYEYINKTNRHNVTGSFTANYELTRELSVQVRSGVDLSYEMRAQERPWGAGAKYQRGSYRTQDIFSMEASSDFLLKYQKKFSKDFTFSATAGGSMLRNKYNKDENRADSLTYPNVYSMANAAGPIVTIPRTEEYGINSFYGLMTGSYKDFLFLDITGRQDWNSVLATPKRTTNAGFFYPSANMSFVVSEVAKLPDYISFAKVRLSASSVGSGTTTPYRTEYYYESAGSLYSGGLNVPNVLANPDLRPLRTTTYEVGANVQFFNKRIGFDIALYRGNTKDQILQPFVDPSSGYNYAIINAGVVQNKGIEIALNTTPVQTKDGFKWSSNVVFSSNKNQIKSLPDSSLVLQTGPVGGGQIVATVGGSMGDLYGRGYQRSPDGQIIYDSQTGVALLTENIIYLGNTIPKFKAGWTNTFNYKQFMLSALFDGQFGAVGHSLTHYKLAEQGKTTNTLPGRYSGIIGNGVVRNEDGTFRKNDVVAYDIDEYYRSHFGQDNAEGSVFSTDFIKFRECRLDYTLKPATAKRIGLQRLTVGVYGRDLFIWSPWPIFDPEFGTLSGTDIVRGFEIGQFPSTRSFGFNVIIGL